MLLCVHATYPLALLGMQDFFCRLLVAYSLTKADLGAMSPSRIDLLPHYGTLVKLVYTKASKKYTIKMKHLLKNSRRFRENELTLDKMMELCLEAAEFQDLETPPTLTRLVVVFNGFTGADALNATRVTIGPDTFSDITLINGNKVSPDWKRFEPRGLESGLVLGR